MGGGIHERVGKLQPMIHSGNFGSMSDIADGSSEEDKRAWKIEKALDTAIKVRGGIRPNSVAGIAGIKVLGESEQLLCRRFELPSEVMLKRLSDEEMVKHRDNTEHKIRE